MATTAKKTTMGPKLEELFVIPSSAAGSAWKVKRGKQKDEIVITAERAVATLMECDAVRERLVRDGVVQIVGDAAVPGHVETPRS